MPEDQDDRQPENEAELELELRRGRKFSPQEAISRLAGPGAMKGESPVSRQQQAEVAIGNWLKSNLMDTAGALQAVLQRQLAGSELVLSNLDQPLAALVRYCEHVLGSDGRLKELVREADVEWGRRMDERPHFDLDGAPRHPADPYTVESVRALLGEVLKHLADPAG